MAEPQTALAGQSAAGDVTVSDAGLRGMISLRGDLSQKKLRTISQELTGQKFPDQGTANVAGDKGLAWMSPDEVLVMVPYGEALQAITAIETALKDIHHSAKNVSDARALITVQGPYVREVIAKLAPADLDQSFAVGMFRRTRLGQVAAAFWRRDDAAIDVICFRSVAGYTFDLLAASAAAGPVGHFK